MVNQWMHTDEEAEKSVCAQILSSPDAFDEVSLHLEPEDFGLPLCQEIYRGAASAYAKGKSVDQITVAAELRANKMLTKIGGAKALGEIVDLSIRSDSLGSHIDIIREKSLLRKLVLAGRSIVGEAMEEGKEAKLALQGAESTIFDLGKEKRGESLLAMPEVVTKLKAELLKAKDQNIIGVSTGFRELDSMTGGLQGGQLIMVAARPAVGKSAFALQMARNIAENSKKVVPFLSYEMNTGELSLRMLSSAVKLDQKTLKKGDFPAHMGRKIAEQIEIMQELPVMIDDNPPETIDGVRSQMRRLARRKDIGAIVVDYLQLITSPRRGEENYTQEVSDISRKLKRLGSELDVPVIALSQLNRSLELRPNKRPNLSDLRSSGSLEQDSNLVLFLYRDVLYNPAADPTMSELIVAKNRSGATGTIYLDFTGECTRFDDTNRRPVGAPPGQNGGGSFSGGGGGSFGGGFGGGGGFNGSDDPPF